jgi:hypothetical protein
MTNSKPPSRDVEVVCAWLVRDGWPAPCATAFADELACERLRCILATDTNACRVYDVGGSLSCAHMHITVRTGHAHPAEHTGHEQRIMCTVRSQLRARNAHSTRVTSHGQATVQDPTPLLRVSLLMSIDSMN